VEKAFKVYPQKQIIKGGLLQFQSSFAEHANQKKLWRKQNLQQ